MTGMNKGWGWSNLLHQKFPSFQHHSDHSTIDIQWYPIEMAEKYGTECGMIEITFLSFLFSVIEWVTNDEIWFKWGLIRMSSHYSEVILMSLHHSKLILMSSTIPSSFWCLFIIPRSLWKIILFLCHSFTQNSFGYPSIIEISFHSF